MKLSYEAIGRQMATFLADPGAQAGDMCIFTDSNTVANPDADDDFCGYIMDIAKDGGAAVVLRGYIEMPYTGTAPLLGWSGLASDGDGAVKASATARQYLVINVRTADKMVGFFL